MDFTDTKEEAEFRAEVREFLAANAEPKSADNAALPALDVPEHVARAKTWQRKKYDAGLAAITWPEAFGGRALSPIFQVIYKQEEQNYLAPTGVFEIGLALDDMDDATAAKLTRISSAHVPTPSIRDSA